MIKYRKVQALVMANGMMRCLKVFAKARQSWEVDIAVSVVIVSRF